MLRSVIALWTVVYFLLAGFSLDFYAVASPLVAPDYSRRSLLWNKSYRHSLDDSLVSRAPQILTASDLGKRDLAIPRLEDAYHTIVDCYQDVVAHSLQLSELSDESDVSESAIVGNLTAYKLSILRFRSALGDLGRNKGLAYYNRDDDLETLLKNIINIQKQTLSYVDTIVFRVPVVGPILGPIVYDIKCILDEILDAIENVSDAILNVISPLLAECVQDTLVSACNYGLAILTICI